MPQHAGVEAADGGRAGSHLGPLWGWPAPCPLKEAPQGSSGPNEAGPLCCRSGAAAQGLLGYVWGQRVPISPGSPVLSGQPDRDSGPPAPSTSPPQTVSSLWLEMALSMSETTPHPTSPFHPPMSHGPSPDLPESRGPPHCLNSQL